jgi:hypothetical protein
MPINPTTLKALIDTQITNETVDFAITPAEVGGRMKDTIDYTTEQGQGFLVYSALISQSGTSIPTLKQLKNTTGVTFTTSFLATGIFTLDASSNIVASNKTATIYSFNSYGEFANGRMDFYIAGANSFQIETRNSGTLANDIITDAFIEIRIYP